MVDAAVNLSPAPESSPTDQTFLPVKPPSKLSPRLHNLPLQDRKPHEILAILWPHPRNPDALVRLAPWPLRAPINHHVGGILVPADVANEVNAAAAGPRIVEVALEAERAQVAF